MMKYLNKSLLFRTYSRQNEAEQILTLSCMFSVAMVVLRVVYTGELLFVFLFWNLFLAFVPYVFSSRLSRRTRSTPFLLLATFAWLLFIPNAFYIITDLFHLEKSEAIPLWYDLALLLAFAWSGLLFGVLSVRQMERSLEQHFKIKFEMLFVIPVMFLNGLGVYIGRYLRFNSWDVITSLFQLAEDMVYLFIHPIQRRFDWSMIICYSLLITLIYFGFKKMAKAWQ